ncbi:hypothetical protein C8R47DRAFT_1049395 [Mycena vitilis]|nr:hypothetical protein C8R47DRAFT_1049395 [Mycena vitilis]
MSCWNCGAVFADRNKLLRTPTTGLSFSGIQHLLESNSPPSDNEIPLVTGIMADTQRRMNALTARIIILKSSMDRLISERDALAERSRQCAAVLSPIRRLPSELVCELFSWTLPCTRHVAGSTMQQASWRLGHISGTWREIALAFPSLWTSIPVFHSKDHRHETVTPLIMVQTQLIRSANARLDVNMEWSDAETGEAAPFMDALLQHSNRWGFFRLMCCDEGSALLHNLRPAKGHLSQLHTLEVLNYGIFAPPFAIDTFSIAPRLRDVLLTNPAFDYVSPTVVVPWKQVTRYRGVTAVEQLRDILRAASNLVEAAFGFASRNGETFNDTDMMFPHLRRLYVDDTSLLANLAAPKVEYLSCDTVASILPFIQRSSCCLTTLVLTQGHMTLLPFRLAPEATISLLQNIASLKNLVLQASSSRFEENDRVLSAMTMTGSSRDLCPNLVYLAYGCIRDVDIFSCSVFIAMVRSRLVPERSCRLSSLRLLSNISGFDGRTKPVEALRDEGLDAIFVDLRYIFIDDARYSFILG